ncbi:Pentatricopeptide repeat [Macleaya cordata]|uniref:Pentatricopeptide repeat n=1 Tax=Macleaya cordata TaxID=56857 RepID=A0A200RBW3_MACCD|nr:Pentatricopeptide repeat [Macleaya cordata]
MAPSCANHQRLLSYTKLLTSHVNQARHEEALSLFNRMHSTLTLFLDPFVFPLALKSCAALNRSQLGKSIHAHTTKSSLLSNPFVACALVNMYGKCVSVSTARQLFDEIPQRNVVVWNSMISLYSRSNDISSALQLFEVMDVEPNASSFNSIMAALSELKDGSSKAFAFYRRMQSFNVKPNLITVLALLPACVGLASLNLVREIHGYSIRTLIDSHTHLSSNLVEAYGRCGCLLSACSVFDKMRERDVVSWSSMISAYAFHGEAKKALAMFEKMESAKIRPDGIAFLGVLKACSHSGLADEAKEYFSRMQIDYGLVAGSDHYACLVDVLSRAGKLFEAYEVIKEMPVMATAKAWGALLGACRSYGEVELAEIAGRVLFEIEPENAGNYVLLASVYAAAGRLDEADKVRKEMKERGVKTSPGSSWIM